MPLAVGNYWTYGAEIPDSLTWSVDSVINYTYQNTQLNLYLVNLHSGWLSSSAYYFYKNGALYQCSPEAFEPDHPVYLFRYPVRTGEQWTNEIFFLGSPGEIDYYTCLSKTVSLSVTAGTFTCYDYKVDKYLMVSDSVLYSEHFYFTPGIGLIARKTIRIADNKETDLPISQQRLTDYKIH